MNTMGRMSRREFLVKSGKFAAVSGAAVKYFCDIPEINVAIYEDSEIKHEYAQRFFDEGYPSIINDMFLDIGVSVNFEGPFTTEFSGTGGVDQLPAAGPLTTKFSGGLIGGKSNDWNAIYDGWKNNAPNKSSFGTVHSKMLISKTHGPNIGIGGYHFAPCMCSHADTAIAWVGNNGFHKLKWTVAHELGHNIGLHHGHANAELKTDKYTKSIMYSDEITKIGVNSFGQPQPDYETIKKMNSEFTYEFNEEITSKNTNLRSLK